MKRQSSPAKSQILRPKAVRATREALAVGAIVTCAVFLRLLFVFSLQDTPFFLEHFSDSRLYMQLVEQIRGGGIEGAYFMSPLYPYLVAAVAELTGNPELWVRILQALFGGATTLLVFRIAKERFSPVAGFLASAIVALYAPIIYYDGLLLTESLQTLLITGHLLLLLRAVDSGELRSWIASGVLLGLAVVTRATVVVFLPVFIVVWIFLRKDSRPSPRYIAAFAVSVLLTFLPTAMHNAAEEDRKSVV